MQYWAEMGQQLVVLKFISHFVTDSFIIDLIFVGRLFDAVRFLFDYVYNSNKRSIFSNLLETPLRSFKRSIIASVK